MPSYGECQTAEIDAPPQACFDALTDFERLPDWQGAVRDVEVLEREALELDLRIEPGRFVPGVVRKAISDAVIRRALRDLKAHLEP
ncbi:MAG: hypothetical protein M3376_13240 [Actinomycetota bacterium]|nr:hypothetical protein [Actinomycetota bacterium]